MADIGGYGTSQMPLAGAIICCTSIPPEQRTELGAIGAQMGATIKLDLTSDVTHLVVGNINSAKYRYVAKAREDVKVLLPEWLEALRTVWMEGDDVDVAALDKEYRLPTFHGLKICLTGFDNPDQRKFIQDAVVQNGAEYHGDLTKTVTHLIAATPSGKKYEHAVNWRMKVVSWEWLQQSLERGMALDETCYNPTIPAEERGQGAWDRRRSVTPTLGKRVREAEQGRAINPLRRKLRRSASSRMGSQSEALWAGITAGGLERHRSTDDDWTDEAFAKQRLRRDNSPTAQSDLQTGQDDLHDDAQPADPAVALRPTLSQPSRKNDGIFAGRVVFPHGFDSDKTAILRQHLESNGAFVIRTSAELGEISSDDLRRGYLVVPHDVETDLTSLPGASGAMALVTNWWVELCLHGKCLVDPTDNILCRPLNRLSISGFNDLILHSTAFVGIELLHVTKVVQMMGATYDEYLTPKVSVLVCNTKTPSQEKFKFATENRIPAVHSQWLWDCLASGELQPFDKYMLNNIASQTQRRRDKMQPFTEVPTAPLSEEDSAKLRKKKSQGAKSISKSRSSSRRPGALDLTTSADLTSLSADSSTNPNTTFNKSAAELELDTRSIGGFDGSTSLPLGDIDPMVNSPRRPSTSSTSSKSKNASAATEDSASSSEYLIRPRTRAPIFAKESTPDSVIPPETNPGDPELPAEELELEGPVVPEKDLSGMMSEIIAARRAAAANANNVPDPDDPKKKKRRQLGRAQSTRSNPSSAGELLSREEDRFERKGYVEYQPSQELGWAADGLGDNGVQAIVKDVVRDSGLGVGGRRARRRG